MELVEFSKLAEYIEKDLPQSLASVERSPIYNEVYLRLKCKITGKSFVYNAPKDKYGEELLIRNYEKAKSEILVERGKIYTSTYVSPSTFYSPKSMSPIDIDEILNVYEDMVKPKPIKKPDTKAKKEEYNKNDDYGLF